MVRRARTSLSWNTTTPQGQDDDNPNEELFSTPPYTRAALRLDSSSPWDKQQQEDSFVAVTPSREGPIVPEAASSSDWKKLAIRMINVIHGLAGLLWFSYAFLLCLVARRNTKTAQAIAWTAAAILLSRCLLATGSSGRCLRHFGLLSSCALGWMQAATWLGLGVYAAFLEPHAFARYCRDHLRHVTPRLMHLFQSHYIWILLVAIVWDVATSWLLLWMRRRLLQRLDTDDYLQGRRARRTSWWRPREIAADDPELGRSLLAAEERRMGIPAWVHRREGNGRRRRGWFFFRNSHTTDGDEDHGPRDDCSVDFASVQEEWASRAEEDPVWWAREEEDRDKSPLRPGDTSWATAPQDEGGFAGKSP